MFQIAMLHSNNNPDLDSFLRPIADELNKLSTNGMVVMKNGEEISRACVVPLMVTGDIPAVAKIIHHPGHNSFYGCRFCYTCGEHAENGYGMYFPKRGCPLRPKETLVPESSKPKPAKASPPEPDNITKANAFKNSPSFGGVEFFGLDEMHMVSNVAKLVYQLLAPTSRKSHRPDHCTDKKYPFFVDNASLNLIQQGMNKSRANIPLAFSGCFKGINQNSTMFYRSVDWLGFLLYIVPTLVIPILVDKSAQSALLALVRACAVTLQWSVTETETCRIEA